MRMGNKKIFHLEAWTVRVMSHIKVRRIPTFASLWLTGAPQHFFYDIDLTGFDD
jgi:hypothetical protein